MRSGKELLLEGARAAPTDIRRSSFCRKFKVESELAFKEACMAERTITYHMQLGLNNWPDTREQIREVMADTGEAGHTVHRFGLTLDRGMSVPEASRNAARKETGPRLERGDWAIGFAIEQSSQLGIAKSLTGPITHPITQSTTTQSPMDPGLRAQGHFAWAQSQTRQGRQWPPAGWPRHG